MDADRNRIDTSTDFNVGCSANKSQISWRKINKKTFQAGRKKWSSALYVQGFFFALTNVIKCAFITFQPPVYEGF